jgi:hypothetical protein
MNMNSARALLTERQAGYTRAARPARTTRFTALAAALLVLGAAGADEARAQDIQTLFSAPVAHGGFGGPVVKFGSVRGDLGVWVGGRGGWIIGFRDGHSLSIGGGGYGLATSHPAPDPADAGWPEADDLRARVGYGGFELEYTNRSRRLLHWTATTLVGAGSVALERGAIPVTADEPTFFVVEPGVFAELNVTSFLRLHTGLTYRQTRGIDRAGFTDRDFSGANGLVAVKFGGFP